MDMEGSCNATWRLPQQLNDITGDNGSDYIKFTLEPQKASYYFLFKTYAVVFTSKFHGDTFVSKLQ